MQCDERSKCYQGAWHGKHGKNDKQTYTKRQMNKQSILAVVVTQLVERLLPIPEACGLNPVISKNLYVY